MVLLGNTGEVLLEVGRSVLSQLELHGKKNIEFERFNKKSEIGTETRGICRVKIHILKFRESIFSKKFPEKDP